MSMTLANEGMAVSARGIDFIKSFEGLVLTCYDDGAGKATIGYGHTATVTGDDIGVTTITEAEAERLLLEHDLPQYVAAVIEKVSVPLNQSQFDAMVSFTFNVGISALGRSTALRLLNASNPKDPDNKAFIEAVNALTWWNKVGGEVWPGLTRRRNAEAEMMMEISNAEREGDLTEPGMGPGPSA